MVILKWVAIAIALLGGLAVAAGQFGLLSGRAPGDLGVRDGRLKPPSATENSVSSQAALFPDHPQRRYAEIAPLALRGSGAETLTRLRALVETMPGARVESAQADYLYATFTTPLMKYVDDVEFWFDPAARVVHVRSASRIGRGDLGLNRKRVEAIRSALA